MSDLLVIGGGVVGLSIAYEASRRGRNVTVIDAGQPGREASWAGAGILPPAGHGSLDPLEQLTALSNRLHAQWTDELRSETGCENGYRRCGGLYITRHPKEIAALPEFTAWLESRHIAAERLTAAELATLEPALKPTGYLAFAYLLTDECQIRNPRHLKALLTALAGRGVTIVPEAGTENFEVRGGRITQVRTRAGNFSADQICIATGSWTSDVVRQLGVNLSIKPVRGQIALVRLPEVPFTRIVNEGPRYLVPRDDGRVLIGSTEEDAGFDRSTSQPAIDELLAFAASISPCLAEGKLEQAWAGLRPASRDGLPYLGAIPGLDNAWIAAGHFRSGLQLSPGTATVLNQLMAGEPPEVELAMFSPERPQAVPPRRPAHATSFF
jgi:glycine oxidase